MKEFLKANKGCVLAIVLISPVVVAFFEYIFLLSRTIQDGKCQMCV